MPNEFGGREDLDAVAFLKELNEVAHAREPGVISAAEESTAWPGVSRPTYLGGLGFGFKWNMGWMHDTLELLPAGPGLPPLPPPRADVLADVRLQRELHPAAVSHDEVVHGKGSLLDEDARRPLAEARQPALRCTPTCGRTPARSCCSWARSSARSASGATSTSLDWHLLEDPRHAGVQSLVRDLNHVYREHAGAVGASTSTPTRLLLAGGQRRRGQRRRLLRARRGRGERRARLRLQPLAGAARRLPRRPARGRPLARGCSTPTPGPTAARTSATSAG